jgi:hypothetical protein
MRLSRIQRNRLTVTGSHDATDRCRLTTKKSLNEQEGYEDPRNLLDMAGTDLFKSSP